MAADGIFLARPEAAADGIPLAVKDLLDTAGLTTTYGSAVFAEHVPSQLTGTPDLEQALRQLRDRHGVVVCATLGDRGAMAFDGDRLCCEPAFQVHALDTTGAGDVFRGGFIYGLVQAWPIDRALRFANAAAAVSCTRLGALNGVPTMDEVQTLMAAGVVHPQAGERQA